MSDARTPASSLDGLLNQGILAARSGRRERARELLLEVIRRDEGQSAAWFWLSNVVDDPEEQEICLENVLALDPENYAAQKALEQLRERRANPSEPVPPAAVFETSTATPGAAVPAASPSAKGPAAPVAAFGTSTAIPGAAVPAASPSAKGPAAPVTAFGTSTAIPGAAVPAASPSAKGPAAPVAAFGTSTAIPGAAVPVASPSAKGPAAVGTAPVLPIVAVSPAAAGPTAPAAAVEPQPAGQPDDDYLCPFCLAPTRPEERRCRSCGASLWARSREQEEHSTRFRLVLALQAICVGASFGALILLFSYVTLKLKAGDLPTVLKVYLGTYSGTDPRLPAACFSILPRSSVYLITFVALFSLLVLVGLAVRWKGAFYLVLVNGGGLLMVGITMTGVLWGAMNWGDQVVTVISRLALLAVDAILVVVVLAIVLDVRDDFFFEKDRLLFRLDREPVTPLDFLVHARRYSQAQAWGLAALHFREALTRGAGIEAALGLAAAYLRLHRPALAAQALAQARQIKGKDPRIEELEQLLRNN